MKDKLNNVLAELAAMVDEGYHKKRDGYVKDGGRSVRTVDTVSGPFRTNDFVLVGVHRKRTFSVTLYSSGEMTVAVACRSECRLKISSSTILTRFNILMGRRIKTGNDSFDMKYIVRTQSKQDIYGFLQRSDVMEIILYLIPFYLLSTESEIISVQRELDYHSIRAGTLLELLERTVDFANQIEKSFPCEPDQEKEQS
ncbi:MAG: hypothetical protein KAT47_04690 [Candidatus Aegiribacteria sp.]|nr:hypothetical protein [Candidatus Aegiribacteria sp.]